MSTNAVVSAAGREVDAEGQRHTTITASVLQSAAHHKAKVDRVIGSYTRQGNVSPTDIFWKVHIPTHITPDDLGARLGLEHIRPIGSPIHCLHLFRQKRDIDAQNPFDEGRLQPTHILLKSDVFISGKISGERVRAKDVHKLDKEFGWRSVNENLSVLSNSVMLMSKLKRNMTKRRRPSLFARSGAATHRPFTEGNPGEWSDKEPSPPNTARTDPAPRRPTLSIPRTADSSSTRPQGTPLTRSRPVSRWTEAGAQPGKWPRPNPELVRHHDQCVEAKEY